MNTNEKQQPVLSVEERLARLEARVLELEAQLASEVSARMAADTALRGQMVTRL